tara:strand:- start:229 stop:417 length:189 start_codon:yes stop_codon:yes gene_type:complete
MPRPIDEVKIEVMAMRDEIRLLKSQNEDLRKSIKKINSKLKAKDSIEIEKDYVKDVKGGWFW